MPNCSEQIIAIAKTSDASERTNYVDDTQTHRHTDTHADRRKGNQHTCQISSCHVMLVVNLARGELVLPPPHERSPCHQGPTWR